MTVIGTKPQLKPIVTRLQPFENTVHYQTMVSYRRQGLDVGAYLLKRSKKSPISLTFGFQCQGVHSFLSDEQFERSFTAIETGLSALPDGETLTFHLGAYKTDRDRQKTLDKLLTGVEHEELQYLIYGEKARVAELTRLGLREPKTLHLFVTHHAGDAEREKHWTDKVADRLRKVGGDFLGGDTSTVSVERFLRGAWGKGYLHWKNVLEQQLDLKCVPLSSGGMWDYLHYRINPLDSESIAVPQEIVIPDDGPLLEVIRSRRHGTTLLLETEPEYAREYIRLGDTYIGVLTFWDKPGGWPDKRAQLHYLYNLVAHDVVTDTEIIVQLKAGNDKKLNWKLSKLTKQGLAKSNYRKSKGDLDVASDLKARLGEEAQLRVLMGEVPLHVAVVILVRRKSLSDLEDACRFIANSFKRPAWVVRERQIAWDIWRQTLPIVEEPLLVSISSPAKTDRRLLFLKEEAMGFLPVVKTYSRDTRGLELIAEDGGTPVYIDLFSPGNDKHRHVLVIGMNRSGKSVIVAGIMIQATLHQVPIVAIDYPKETGESTYSTFTHFMDGFGAYFNVAKESINLFEIPNLYNFTPEVREIRLNNFKDFLVTCLQAMVVLDSPDILLNQTIRTCLYDAINRFFENRAIEKRYYRALTAPFGLREREKIPTLKTFLAFFQCQIGRGFFKTAKKRAKKEDEKEGNPMAETLIEKALNQISLRLNFWTNSMVGKAISRPSSVRTNALLTVLALTNVSDNEDAAVLSLVAYAFSLKRAMEYPLSIFFIDESPILFKFSSVRQIVESIISNGAKSGIRCIIRIMTTTNNNRLAVLAGLEEESTGPLNIEIRTESGESTAPMSESLFPEEEIESGFGVDRWSFGDKKRLPRLFLVALAFGILGLAGMFLYSLRGTTVQPLQGETPGEKTESKTPEGSDPELARTKARLGLQTQRQLLNRPAGAGVPNGGERENATRRRESSPNRPVRTRTAADTSSPPVPAAPRVRRDRVEPSYRTVRPSRAPREDYSLTSTRPVIPSERAYPPRSTGENGTVSVGREAIDPGKAWLEASRVGSFGDSTGEVSRPSRTRPVSNPAVGSLESPESSDNTLPTDDIAGGTEGEAYPEEAAILEDRVIRHVKVPAGTKVRGVLETAIVTGGTDTEGEIYPIRLTGDVTDRDGRVLMPKESIVFVSVKGARGGVVQLQTDSVLLAGVTDATDEPLSLPPTAFSIRRVDGSPLIARSRSGESGGGGTDVGGLLFDVFSTAAGMLGGGGDDAYRHLYQMERIREIYDRRFGGNRERTTPTVSPGVTGWELEAGTEVSLYVTKPFTLALESPASDNGATLTEESDRFPGETVPDERDSGETTDSEI